MELAHHPPHDKAYQRGDRADVCGCGRALLTIAIEATSAKNATDLEVEARTRVLIFAEDNS